jgi:hypothetical protein
MNQEDKPNHGPVHHLCSLLVAILTTAALGQSAVAQPAAFEEHFTGQTLRFDYYHSGIASEERISLDQIRLEGKWVGSRANLLDKTNLGKYYFEVIDASTNQAIYSRGFASIFGEWETTNEALNGLWRTFHESQRFPEPRNRIQLVLKKRAADGLFREICSVALEPSSRFVDRSPITERGIRWQVFENGPPEYKVDLLVLGDGYLLAERDKFHRDVERLVGELFKVEPFRSRKSDFNVWAIDLAAPQSGISNPRAGVWRNNVLGLSFNAFDSDRYVLTYRNRDLREIAAQVPYDTMIILFNQRKYGGGGIFNLWATCTADSSVSDYVFIHEFGHSFAGLADEYYTSDVAYVDFTKPGIEPWEPNITALLDPAKLKWRSLVRESTPIPTPWEQEVYDQASYKYQEKRRELRAAGASEEELEELFAEVKDVTASILARDPLRDVVGAFEGAGYQAKGLYRPEIDCIMFSRNTNSFCQVCQRALERVIDLYTE